MQGTLEAEQTEMRERTKRVVQHPSKEKRLWRYASRLLPHPRRRKQGKRERAELPARKQFKAEWTIYRGARERCTNPKHISWKYYGGRGIEFRFRSFVKFLAEVGPRPAGREPSGMATYSIHRIDNDGHYEPGNVKWATRKEQLAPGSMRPYGDAEPATVEGPTILPLESTAVFFG